MTRHKTLNSAAIALFLGIGLLTACVPSNAQLKPSPHSGDHDKPTPTGKMGVDGILKVRFLGTGAADWDAESYRGEHRNLSSILVDNHILVDYTAMAKPQIPSGCYPKIAFYTHSHGDHFNAADAISLGVETMYVSMSWYTKAKEKVSSAASAAGKTAPKVVGINLYQPIIVDGITFTALPANHATGDFDEQAVIYLMEKDKARVLYATDTGGIMGNAARYAGIDPHLQAKAKPITGLIMEATMGMDHDTDYRIFTHTSVGTVLRTAQMLKANNMISGSIPVYLTHIAKTLHPTQKELNTTLPAPLAAAYDGLEVDYPTK